MKTALKSPITGCLLVAVAVAVAAMGALLGGCGGGGDDEAPEAGVAAALAPTSSAQDIAPSDLLTAIDRST